MDKFTLNAYADRIEQLAGQHNITLRCTGGRMTQKSVSFNLALAASARLARLEGITKELSLALGVDQVSLERIDGRLALVVPLKRVAITNLSEIERVLAGKPLLKTPGVAALGVDFHDNQPVILRLGTPETAHVLVVGTTGSGKTELVKTILSGITRHQNPSQIQFLIADPKKRKFEFVDKRFLLKPIAFQIEDILGLIDTAVGEMVRRDQSGFSRPMLVFVIDELNDVLVQGSDEAQSRLSRILSRGREAGICVVACTQHPSSKVIASVSKANFPVRIVGRVSSASDSMVATGRGGIGAEELNGRGDFILVYSGDTVRFQAALCEPGIARSKNILEFAKARGIEK